MSDSYIIYGGKKGSDRLKVLTESTWENTKENLIKAGLKSGMKILDVGCGNGAITEKLAEILGNDTQITAADFDKEKIEIAKNTVGQKYKNINFIVSNISKTSEINKKKYDFINARFVLSHLINPKDVLQKLKKKLNPNGIIYVEDVDFDGYFCYPKCNAFEKYKEYYKKIGAKLGADPLIGPKLLRMFLNLNFKNVNVLSSNQAFNYGGGKLIAPLTFEAIAGTIIDLKFETKESMENLIQQLYNFQEQKDTIISLPRFFHVWGTN